MKNLALVVSFLAVSAVSFAAGMHSPGGDQTVTTVSGSSCTNNSDCKFGGCTSGKCGSCSNNSECKGWGGCSGGWCGSCSNNSDCKGFGDCTSGKCTKPPY